MKCFTILAFFGFAQAFLQGEWRILAKSAPAPISEASNATVVFSPNLTCFSCIQNDYIYCVKGAEHQVISMINSAPEGVCC